VAFFLPPGALPIFPAKKHILTDLQENRLTFKRNTSKNTLMAEQEGEKETITTTIEVNKELFLKFKALCVLKELTISGEIEKLIKTRVDQLTEQGK
jgi:hypothetical protein